MFGTSVRSVTRPIRGYVCFSCLARRNIQLPPQILRFQSTGPAQTSSGAAPSDDSILCTIKEHEKGRNGDGASIESSGSADASRNGGAQIDSSGVSELVAGTAAKDSNDSKPRKKTKSTKKPTGTVRKVSARKPKAGGAVPRKVQSKKEAVQTGDKGKDAEKAVLFEFIRSAQSHSRKGPRSRGAEKDEESSAVKKMLSKKKLESANLDAEGLDIIPLDTDMPSVPKLSYGLERVLFNPGVYHLQDPRSRVYNFDPYLGSIMPISEFDFDALKEYITSSRDKSLSDLASKEGKKYVGSSSSMTSVLSHFHYLLSHWRPVDTSTLSQGFPDKLRSFTKLLRGPAAIFLRYKDGAYAIDADKEFDSANVLMNLGKSMEKLLTLPTEDFERYRRSSENKISEEEQGEPEAYHYSTLGDFVMRSQLDAYDPRLPGTGMFDLKTRAVVSIRMDTRNYEQGLGYQIKGRFGGYESYEREYFDMIRAAFLKYSLQVRVGRMDGIFVAFHNIQRIFGFQYISLPEMDQALHGQCDTTLGDTEFKLSISLWNKILNKATARFPNQSLRMHFETRESQSPFMYIFAEPVTDDEINEIQTKRAGDIEILQKKLLNPQPEEDPAMSSSPIEFKTGSKNGFQSLEEALGNGRDSEESTPAEEEAGITESGTVDSDCLSATEQGSPQVEVAEEELNNTEEYDSTSASDPESANELSEENTTEEENSESVSESPDDKQPKDAAETLAEPTSESADKPGEQNDAEEYDSEAASDADFLDEISESKQEGAKDLLGMTLTIKNKINDQYMQRPSEFTAGDKWTVDYELTEFASGSRAWKVYEACQKRRSNLLWTDEAEADDVKASYYLQTLRKLSQEGRRWRKTQDEMDQDDGLKFLDLEKKTPTS